MTYKEALVQEMNRLSKVDNTIFIGYNVAYGPMLNGTLCDVPMNKKLEMPVAENLMMGIAMGMSLEGYLPIVCFERMDFMLIAMDAIINHLDKLPKLSGGQFNFPVIIRATVGHDKPLDPGIQHKSDYTQLIADYTSIEVRRVIDPAIAYANVHTTDHPILLVDYKMYYDLPVSTAIDKSVDYPLHSVQPAGDSI